MTYFRWSGEAIPFESITVGECRRKKRWQEQEPGELAISGTLKRFGVTVLQHREKTSFSK